MKKYDSFLSLTRKIHAEWQNKIHSISEKLHPHRDSIRYYAILTAILTVLGTAAYLYRSDYDERDCNPIQSTESASVTANTLPIYISPSEEEIRFVPPVNGQILAAYCEDELVWSEDLLQWQTHPAVDIGAVPGEAVVAIADGKITEVYSDALFGNTIVIEHENIGIVRYASLNTLQLAAPGQTVRQGEVISSAGNCPAESSLGPHVHIECISEGEYVDPSSIISDFQHLRE